LSVDPATQSQSIDNVSLIQHYLLSVDPATQSQSIDNVSLVTDALVISVDPATQSQNIDNITLTSHNSIIVDSLTQEQLIDIVFMGGIVVGYLEGEISVFSAYNGELQMINTLNIQ
ncbi:MAG: hypothetical protein GY928_00580, partial [Colwellia sp.]|nr:hypothetical protein [Colwellia sp.]